MIGFFGTSGAYSPAEAKQSRPEAADVTVAIVDRPDPVMRGDEVTYEMTVTNLGPGSAKGVDLHAGGVYDNAARFSSTQGACTLPSSQLICQLGDLPNHASATIWLTVTAEDEGELRLSAWAYWNYTPEGRSGSNWVDAVTTVQRNPLLPELSRCGGRVEKVPGTTACWDGYSVASDTWATLQLEPALDFTGTLSACLNSCSWYFVGHYVAGQLVWGASSRSVFLGGADRNGHIRVDAGGSADFAPLAQRCYYKSFGYGWGGGAGACTPEKVATVPRGLASGSFSGSLRIAP